MKLATITSLFVLTLVFTTYSASEAQSGSWTHTDGPYGGSVRALHLSGDGLMLAGTLGQGILFSNDGGQSWLQSNLENVSVYDFAHGSGRTYFAATQNGVYRSDNNGRSWQRTSGGMEETRVQSVLVHEEGLVFAATLVGGIYVSDDNGSSWQEASEGLSISFAYALSQLADGTVLAGVANRIYRSEDGGGQWMPAESGFPHVRTNAFAATADELLYAGTQNGVYRSEDGGQSWQETGNQFADTEVYDLVTTGEGVIYAATRNGVYASADEGATWELDGLSSQPVYSLGHGGGVAAAGANPGVYTRN
ncbi:MAG: hypothetical protein R6U28_13625 [Cyclonatronaceae bacterium]